MVLPFREIVAVDGAQVVGQFVDDGLAGRDFQMGDLVIGDVGEMLDQCAQRIAMGGDQHALAGLEVGGDRCFPIGQDAGDRVLEAFGRGDRAAVSALLRPVRPP